MLHEIGIWDIVLKVVDSIQTILLAYRSQPHWKATISTLPLPFTVANLALGQPIGVSNVVGLALFFTFFYGSEMV